MSDEFKIISYLNKNNMSVKEFSAKCGVCKSTLYLIEQGARVSPTTAYKVAIATGGKVLPRNKHEVGRPRK